jgi:hypothetical protein
MALTAGIKAQVTNVTPMALITSTSTQNEQALRDRVATMQPGVQYPGDSFHSRAWHLAMEGKLVHADRVSRRSEADELARRTGTARWEEDTIRHRKPIGWATRGISAVSAGSHIAVDQRPAVPLDFELPPDKGAVFMPPIQEPQSALALVESACRQIQHAVGSYDGQSAGRSSSTVALTLMDQQRANSYWSTVLQRVFQHLMGLMTGRANEFSVRPQAGNLVQSDAQLDYAAKILTDMMQPSTDGPKWPLSTTRPNRAMRHKRRRAVDPAGSHRQSSTSNGSASERRGQQRDDRAPPDTQSAHGDYDMFILGDALGPFDSGGVASPDKTDEHRAVERKQGKGSVVKQRGKVPSVSLATLLDPKAIIDMYETGFMAWEDGARPLLARARGIPISRLSEKDPSIVLAERQQKIASLVATSVQTGGLSGPHGDGGAPYDNATIPVLSEIPDVSERNVKPIGEVVNRQPARRL